MLKKILIPIVSLIIFSSCEWQKEAMPRYINVPKSTSNLQAIYVIDTNVTLSSACWQQINYKTISLEDITTGKLPQGDGLLNMSGMIKGILTFGSSANMTLKAAYNDDYIFILATWNVKQAYTQPQAWYFNGPSDPLQLASDSSGGWTRQNNADNLFLYFTIDSSTNTKDVWQWNVALSNPLGYAIDLNQSANGTINNDAGTQMFGLNIKTSGNNRSGPLYDWSGNVQKIKNAYTTDSTSIDQTYYLTDTSLVFQGDVARGRTHFNDTTSNPIGCIYCHGVDGSGGTERAINNITMSSKAIMAFAGSSGTTGHGGAEYFEPLSQQLKTDVVAFLRALTKIPGFVLRTPTNSAADILAESNVNLIKVNTNITKYTVLLKRKLKTNHPDDVTFNVAHKKNYVFDLNVTSNDELNRVGQTGLTLQFIAPTYLVQ